MFGLRIMKALCWLCKWRVYDGIRLRHCLSIWLYFFIATSIYAQVEKDSGHHYSWVEGAKIGHDFGRNPWGGGSEGFATVRGQTRLQSALQNAVVARETRMSFGFDFRSLVISTGEQMVLDDYVLLSIDSFLKEVERADLLAQEGGRRFAVDVVLTDYRMVDGIASEGSPPVAIGEHPEFLTDESVRRNLLLALAPALEKLGQHPRVTLVLMNEPSFSTLSVAVVDQFLLDLYRAVLEATIPDSDFDGNGAVDFVDFTLYGRQFGSLSDSVFDLVPDGRVNFADFLVFASEFGKQAGSRVTIGWRNDQSALEGTQRLEIAFGGPVTPVISFHVYDVPESVFHPLTLTREDFERAGFGDREIRVTEWGLGTVGQAQMQRDIVRAFEQVEQAGFDGVSFWWDAVHLFEHDRYREALTQYLGTR
jgi:hypothetical protein